MRYLRAKDTGTSFTVTVHTAATQPVSVALIVVVPGATPVTRPMLFTTAISLLPVIHTSLASFLCSGFSTHSCMHSNIMHSAFSIFIFSAPLVTLTKHSARPILVLTLMIASPSILAVTTPVSSTVATLVLLDSHNNASVLTSGVIVTTNVSFSPTSISNVVAFSEIVASTAGSQPTIAKNIITIDSDNKHFFIP